MNEIHHADIVSGKHLDDVESVGERELSRFYNRSEEAMAPGKIGDITEEFIKEAQEDLRQQKKDLEKQ